jgi:hypothetical protein
MTKTFKELRESTSVDEISLKSLSKTISKATNTKNVQLAMKKSKDKTRDDLAAMRKRLDSLKAGYAAESVELDEAISKTIDAMKQIVAKKQAMKIDGVMVDMFTASAVTQIYDKVNDANKAKMDKMKATQLASVAMKMLKKEGVENLEEMKNTHALIDTADGNKVVAMASSEQGVKQSKASAERPPMSVKDKNTLKIVKLRKAASQKASERIIGYPLKEEVEQLEELTAAEKKLIDQMYDKKGNLTPLGKKVFAAGQKNESVELDEAPRRKGAPKMTGDSIAIQRAKDAEHAKAMGRSVKTGRKLPKKTMTSTQMSLASLRREEVELDEAKGMNMNLKLINKIKKSGVVKTGSMSKDGSKKEETNEVLDTPKAMQSYKDKANYSRDKAARSAVATTLRSKDKAQRDHPAKDLKTMDKRTKGLKMADRNAKLKTFNALRRKEDVSEAKKGGYDIYHKDFSGAMQHAYAAAKKNYGITIKPSEIDNKVASGPRKPSSGKTNTYRLEGDKGAIQVQVYNTGSKYELNMYKE